MNDSTKAFLEEVKKERVKRIRGLLVDLYYYDVFLKENNEDKTRDELAEEEKKLQKDQNGRIIADNRDIAKVQKLNRLIDKIVNTKQEKLKYEEVLADIKKYTEMVCTNPSEELTKKLDEADKI